jgi:hypothetical protein
MVPSVSPAPTQPATAALKAVAANVTHSKAFSIFVSGWLEWKINTRDP